MDPSQNFANWPAYNTKQRGRPVRPLCAEAMELSGPGAGRQAIDLGAGAGVETAALADAGWKVLAIDAAQGTSDVIRNATRGDAVEVWERSFDEVRELPEADLVFAGYSLPFARPVVFEGLWSLLVEAVRPQGWFAGNFFGPRDSWAGREDMTFTDREDLGRLFGEFEIHAVHERNEEGASFSGPKHWHVFSVIARKR